jgi:hypothetical protein
LRDGGGAMHEAGGTSLPRRFYFAVEGHSDIWATGHGHVDGGRHSTGALASVSPKDVNK